jgi:hypothetical protein
MSICAQGRQDYNPTIGGVHTISFPQALNGQETPPPRATDL